MDQLFGASWQNRVQNYEYQNLDSSENRQFEHVDHQKQFQSSLELRFKAQKKQVVQQNNRHYSFAQKVNGQQIKVQLFIYDFIKMKGLIIRKRPSFQYKLSSIYKIPLSQNQWTSWVFRSFFNCIQAQNLFISIEYQQTEQKQKKLLIQLSKFQSDVLNLKKGKSRLSCNYWKPIILEKEDIKAQIKISFLTFLQKIIRQTDKIQYFFFKFKEKNGFCENIFKLLSNPLNFIELNQINHTHIDLSEYFSKKMRSTRKETQDKNVQIQYTQQMSENTQSNMSIILYFYNQPETKDIFFTKDLLFTYEKISILKNPLSELQRTNWIFNKNFLVLNCSQFFMSIDLNCEDKVILIQVSKNQEDVINKFKGVKRCQSSYWKSSEVVKSIIFSQSRINLFEKLINVLDKNMVQKNLFGTWKANNNAINSIYQIFGK